MIYYGNQRQLEYDFVVRPGADPGSISLEFQGASKAELDREGGVVMHTAPGDVRWHKPMAYQEINGSRKLVACAYARSGADRLRFALDAYDRTKPLIIDPVLEYSTYLGGSFGDIGTSIAVDAHESAYITGNAFSADFPTKNAFQKNLNSPLSSDAFLSKFDATGNLVYSTYLGGSALDEGRRIAVDVHGNAYVTGNTYSDDFPTKNAFQPSHPAIGRVSDAFVTKLSPAGTLVYSTYLGGSGGPIGPGDFFGDTGSAIAVDAQGNAYITGATNSPDFPTKNAFQNELKQIGATSGFVTKLCPAGNALVYSTYLGGTSGYVQGAGIVVDAQGNAYVTGLTNSPDFPTKNAFQRTLGGTTQPDDAFVTKLDRDGDALVYSTYLGGSGNEAGIGIAVDASRNAYITGTTTSSDFPTKNAFQGNLKNPNGNAFVTKLDADGDSLVYSTYLGGSGNPSNTAADRAYGIAVDAQRNAYITGATPSIDFPTKNAFQSNLAGDINQSDSFHGPVDAFVTKFDVSGNALIYSSYLGGSSFPGDDSGRGNCG
ncbi:MAG: SBBP repeat-containing protein [Bryobacteraceae bacterium]